MHSFGHQNPWEAWTYHALTASEIRIIPGNVGELAAGTANAPATKSIVSAPFGVTASGTVPAFLIVPYPSPTASAAGPQSKP